MNEVTDFWRTASNDNWHALSARMDPLHSTYRNVLDRAIAFLGCPPLTAIDWGVGGGLAAKLLRDDGCHVYGVDIVERKGPFEFVLADIEEPEKAVEDIDADLFVCLTVIQHMPDLAYAERIVRLAADVLVPGGVALFQIRTGRPGHQKRPCPYRGNWTKRVLIAPADFRQIMENAGFAIRESKGGTKQWAGDYHYMIGQT